MRLQWMCVLAGVGLLAAAAYGKETRLKLVANFEKKAAFTVGGKKGAPKVAITDRTASQGRKSLRFEHTEGPGRDRGWMAFPVDGAAGFNAIAFDIYCEEHDASWLEVRLTQRAVGPNKGATYTARLEFGSFIDGWTPVRLGEAAGLTTILHSPESKPDWGQVREVRFRLHRGGKTVFYLDNIRFENISGAGESRNMLYNSSFEKATNPDIPDGWGRDLSLPPFGENVWGLDAKMAFHGSKSLRIGVPGKYARYWMRHLRSNAGQEYTFSIHLNGCRGGHGRSDSALRGRGRGEEGDGRRGLGAILGHGSRDGRQCLRVHRTAVRAGAVAGRRPARAGPGANALRARRPRSCRAGRGGHQGQAT